MEYKFKTRNHWWFDAGIVGLYFIAQEVKNEEDYADIEMDFGPDNLSIRGKDYNKIKEFLEHCYTNLASKYWNVSTKTQKEKNELVIYDKQIGELKLVPKRMPTPVVGKFVKGTSWKAEYLEYENLDPTIKAKVDEYLKDNQKELWGSKKNRLLLSLPECQPKLKILPKENLKRQSTCSVCGNSSSNLSYISQPSFLLFASKNAARSFHTQGNRPARLCWECELLSKFTIHTINYKREGDDILILILNSLNVEHSINNQRKIGSSSILRSVDENYFNKNIGFDPDGLIEKAKLPYELLWAYFIDTYTILESNVAQYQIENDDFLLQLLDEIFFAPLEIIIIHLGDKGQTFITKELIFYNHVSYAYRLINHFLESGINLKSIYNFLYETDNKGNVLPTRDRIFRKILNKHCILLELEGITFRKIFANANVNMSNLLRFVQEYYLIVKGDIMTKEQINAAVNLGKQIVMQAYKTGGKDKSILNKIKGDLYTLRKTRTTTDFVTQLNTLQFRYGISVSKSITEGILNEVPFEDFKGYCIMGALNSFNYLISDKKNKGDEKDD